MPVSDSMRVVIVNEFSDVNCPVTKLVYDLGDEFSKGTEIDVVQANLRTRYRPGGTRWQRILSLGIIHVIMPAIILFQWFAAKMKRQSFCVLVTTLPPLLHWNLLGLSAIFRFRCVVWYQDAHPEIEARILARAGYGRIAKILVHIDRVVLALAPLIVVLDNAMAALMTETRQIDPAKILVAPPWTAFVSPPKPMRIPSTDPKGLTRLIYAGNYGFAHDLVPFAKSLGTLSPEQKSQIAIVGIGMNESSRKSFIEIFMKIGINVETLPRLQSFDSLLKKLEEFDLGIVSLRDDYAGIAAPSKAYTYISQGLPILYVGPKYTLPSQLIQQGFGIDTEDFINVIRRNGALRIARAGELPTDPKVESIATLYKAIYES